MSTHNLCFRAKIRKNVYPCTPQFYYIKVGCKGVFITRTRFHDDLSCIDIEMIIIIDLRSLVINLLLQIIPYMVMEIFDGLPGMPGLFMASLFSASLR